MYNSVLHQWHLLWFSGIRLSGQELSFSIVQTKRIIIFNHRIWCAQRLVKLQELISTYGMNILTFLKKIDMLDRHCVGLNIIKDDS